MYLKKILLLTLAIVLLNTAALASSQDTQEPTAEHPGGGQVNALAVPTDSADNSNKHQEPFVLNTFLESDFIRISVWPGIGPFHVASGDKQLVDPAGNQLTYSTEGKFINSCQLELHAGPNEGQSMLNLQMGVDFLLEGLGAKPAQIHIVNTEVSKNNKLLTGNNYNPVQAIISPLVVSLQNVGVTEGTDSSIYRVMVVNKNLSSTNVSQSKAEENNSSKISSLSSENTKEKAEKEEPAEVAVSSSTSESNNKPPVLATSKSSIAKKQWSQVENLAAKSENSDSKAVTTPNALTKDEQLKKDFQDVIQSWQRLKKTVVKEREASLLSQALAGKALIKQSDNVKWLISNHKYYEMTPGGAKIEKLTPLVAGKKYTVYAEVKEKTKFMDESTKKMLKESDDTYKVSYTIEKIGEHWLITDSALTKTIADKSASEKAKKSGARTPH